MSLLSLAPASTSLRLGADVVMVAGAIAGTLIRFLTQRFIPADHGGGKVWGIEAAVALVLGAGVGLMLPLGSDSTDTGLRACLTAYNATSAYLCMVENRGRPGHGFLPAAGHLLSCTACSVVGVALAFLARLVFG